MDRQENEIFFMTNTSSGFLATSSNIIICKILGGGFKHFLFSPLLGEDSHVD